MLLTKVIRYLPGSLVKGAIILCLSFYSTVLFAQVDTEFWFVVPEISHRGSTGGTPAILRIATLELGATVTIEMPANPGFTPIVLDVLPNDDAAVDFTYLIDDITRPGITGLENKALTPDGINPFGLHITSTNMINAYWEVNYMYGADVWTLKGSNGLGTLFYTPFQTEYPNHFSVMPSYSAIDVVASQDNTFLTFTLPDGVGASYGAPMNTTQTPATPGRTFTIGPLNRGETFSLFPYMMNTGVNAKLAGTRIVSSFPIAVVLKDDNLNTASQGRSTIGDQIVPVDVAGDIYVVPSMGNPNLSFVVATQDNTNIYTNPAGGVPTLVATLNEGDQLRVQSPNNAILVISSRNGISAPAGPPIYVFHMALNNMTRAAALLPPIGCTGNTQLAFTRARENVREDFYFFLITEDENIDNFWIDGSPADPTIISDDASKWERLGNGWSAFKSGNIPASKLAIGQHLVENSGGIFHLGIINGFTSANLGDLYYGYFSDYGGLNVGAVVAGTNSSVIRACYGTPVQLYAFGGTSYEWTPRDYMDDPYSNLPTAINLSPGEHEYVAHVTGTCGAGDVPLTVIVAPPVTANFETNVTSGCSPLEVIFEDQSVGNATWQYDLGDGTPLILYDTLSSSSTVGLPPDPFVFSNTYVNNTDSVVSFEVILMVKNSSACADIIRKTILVFPEIHSDFEVAPDIACDPLESRFTNNSYGDTATWIWEFGDGGSSTEFEPVHEYRNQFDPDNLLFDATLVAISPFNCRDTSTRRVTVRPHIEAMFAYDTVRECSPHEIIITDQSIGADVYAWDFGDLTTSASPGPVLRHTYVNNSAFPVTYTITLRVDNEEGCTDQIQREVTIYPGVDADFIVTPIEDCSPSEMIFQNNTSGAPATFYWEFGDGGSSTEEHPVHYYDRNLLRHDTIFTVMLVATTGEFCRDTALIDVTIHPYIEAAFTIDDVVGCTPFEVIIHNESISADNYYWDFGDGTPVSDDTSAIFNHIYLNSGTVTSVYPLRLITTNEEGCSDTMIRNITVHPLISANFSTDGLRGCHPLTVTFTDLSDNAVNYMWDFGDGSASVEPSPVHTFNNFGTTDSIVYLVTLTTSTEDGECVETVSWPITVYPQVVSEFTFPYAQGCGPFEVPFENLSIGGTSFTWDFGDGTVVNTALADPQTHVFINTLGTTAPQDYDISLVAENSYGCASEIIKSVTVYPDIVAGFDVSDTAGCHPLLVDFTNRTTGGGTYLWDFGDGSTSSSPNHSHLFTNTGTIDSVYTVKLYTLAPNNTCEDSLFIDIRVHPFIQANFVLPQSLGCNPFEVEIVNASVNAGTFYWDFGDGQQATTTDLSSVTHIFNNSGFTSNEVFQVTMRAENVAGCTDQMIRVVEVYPAIVAVIDPNVIAGCHPLQVDFANLSQGGYTYTWDFGDGATSEADRPVHTFTNFTGAPITRTVRLLATSPFNCTSDTTVDITIYPKPQARFETDQIIACAPFELSLTNTSIYGDEFTWTLGSDTLLTMASMDPVNHTFDNLTATITTNGITLLAATSFGCLDTVRQDVYVYPRTTADFSFNDGDCSPFMAYFENESVRGQTYEWDFGDGTSASNTDPSHLYFNLSGQDMVYYITLTSTSMHGCVDAHTDSVDIYAQPDVEFIASPTHQMFPASAVDFTNESNQGYWSYLWDLGDGATSNLENPGTHIYNTWGDYVIWLRAATPYCSDSASHSIRIFPAAPVAAFDTVTGDCEPYTVQFRNQSIYGETYLWEFDDGTTSTDFEPVHTFEEYGYYNVKLTVTGMGGTEYFYREVEVYRMPFVDFRVEPTLVMLPDDEIRLFNLSTHGANYFWDFGDGSGSTEEHPMHLYTKVGQYDISLEVSTEHGCTDRMLKQAAVTVDGEGIILFPNAFKPDLNGPNGGHYDLRAQERNNIFHPYWEGVADYHLEIYTRWGDKLFLSQDVNIGWDGYFKENICIQDVYVFRCWGYFNNGELFQVKGDVTLIHHDKGRID